MIRSLVLAGGCYIHLLKDDIDPLNIPKHLRRFVLLRGIFGFLSAVTFILSIQYLSLSLAVSLFFTSPIFTAMLSYFLLEENLTKFDLLSILSAMIGVILLTEPSIIFSCLAPDYAITNPRMIAPLGTVGSDPDNYFNGVTLALFGSLTTALAFLCCRKIGEELH
jgi:drug/metabolite transporter (DMT)-like permease